MRKIDLVLTEVRELRTSVRTEVRDVRTEMRELRAEVRTDLQAMSGRIDGVNTRLDTVIDALADLRSDLDRHTHDT